MKIALLGASGMLGSMMTRYLSDIGHEVKSFYRQDFDVLSGVIPDLTEHDYVINAIGLIKQKSTDQGLMFFINGDFPHKLATKCKRLIHISSDCVFSGSKPAWESYNHRYDKPDAIDDYGKSKAFGECWDRIYNHSP